MTRYPPRPVLTDLSDTDNQIASQRMRYNDSVHILNSEVRSVHGRISSQRRRVVLAP